MLLETVAWAAFCYHSGLKRAASFFLPTPPKPLRLLSLEIGAEGEASGAPHSVAVLTGCLCHQHASRAGDRTEQRHACDMCGIHEGL